MTSSRRSLLPRALWVAFGCLVLVSYVTGLVAGFRADELAGVGLAEGTSVALFELVAEFLRPVFAAHWHQLEAGVSVDDAAEWILRIILSLLAVRGRQ